jgi:hypothetical protein
MAAACSSEMVVSTCKTTVSQPKRTQSDTMDVIYSVWKMYEFEENNFILLVSTGFFIPSHVELKEKLHSLLNLKDF